jgi:predicted nucleotide-binding protein
MKPRIFIGSSSEALAVANAIHAELDRDAECTVWTQQVFGLGANAVDSLTKQAEESDFAIFVFAADDQATIRGHLFAVPRDNVLYELGLFSGILGPERCFFVTPRGSSIHLPTDLAGITAGDYDANRSDKNLQAAVGPFCAKVRLKLNILGVAPGAIPEQIRELAVSFECCDWIDDMSKRVKMKEDMISQMVSFCRKSIGEQECIPARGQSGF